MSLLPECPVCMGLMTASKRSTLSSACRCGYPDELDWSDFRAVRERKTAQLTECRGDPLLGKAA